LLKQNKFGQQVLFFLSLTQFCHKDGLTMFDLRAFTIKQRLLLNTIAVAVAMVLMLGLFFYESAKLETLGEMRANVANLQKDVLLLRKHEKDFQLRKDSKYLNEFKQVQQLLSADIERLEQALTGQGLSTAALHDFEQSVSEYGRNFMAYANEAERVGLTPTSGLYGELRTAAHALENHFKAVQQPELLVTLLQLRRAEKDFMLRLESKYIEKFDDLFKEFTEQLKSSGQGAELQGAASQFHQAFIALGKGNQSMGLSADDGLQGQMRSAIHATEQQLERMITDVTDAIDSAVSAAKLLAVTLFVIVLTVVVTLVMLTSQSIIRPIDAVSSTISRIRQQNDFRLRVDTDGKDEMSTMAGDFNAMLGDFQDLIKGVNQAMTMLDGATAELAASIAKTRQGMGAQQSESDMVATAVTEMGATIEQIASHTEATATKAQNTNHNAIHGMKEVENTVNSIHTLSAQLEDATVVLSELEKDSSTIGSVLDVIRGIAEQTNLLALNAAIEAARAGEQGRGFAVVADEVRSLAQRTAESTRQIEQIIHGLQSRTRNIVQVMQHCRQQGQNSVQQAQTANDLLGAITADVNTIMEMTTQIATAIDEQSKVAAEVNSNVVRIRDITEESLHIAQQNEQISEEVSMQASVLHSSVDKFRA
jgi:methyl-accepting chemotaxis protein